MEEFTVYVKNRPSQLARVCDELYKNGVNIEALVTEGTREDGTIKLITDDVVTTRRAFENSKIQFDAKEIFVVKVLNRPGELAKLSKKIGVENINIESVYLLGEGKFALRVNDMNRAKKILKEDIIS